MSIEHWTASLGRQSARADDTVIPFEPCDRPHRVANSPLQLARLIEGEIIPRLLLAHRDDATRSTPAAADALLPVTQGEVTTFAAQAVEEDSAMLLRCVEGFLARGLPVEDVFLNLLSPAARRLGSLWEQDLCSFTDVTVGLCRLQQLVYDLGDRCPTLEDARDGRDVLFAVAPGDQHAFGMVLVSEFFRRAGWRTTSLPDAAADELLELVSARAFDLLGVSVTTEEGLLDLDALLSRVRAASRNPRLRIMVGGRLFSDRPSLAGEVGADGTAEDAAGALARADALVGRSARPA